MTMPVATPRSSLVLVGAALLTGLVSNGCSGTPPLPCTQQHSSCAAWDTDCAQASRPQCTQADRAPTMGWVEIESSPTSAAIYQDGRFIGYTPLRQAMGFTSQTGRISLVAVPLFAGQAQQERLIRVPPLPERVTFVMNNPPQGSGTLTELGP